jgi:hypothetical protein
MEENHGWLRLLLTKQALDKYGHQIAGDILRGEYGDVVFAISVVAEFFDAHS